MLRAAKIHESGCLGKMGRRANGLALAVCHALLGLGYATTCAVADPPANPAPTPPGNAAPAGQPPRPILPEPIFTRQTQFSIPFRLGPAPNDAAKPVEVLLGVSVDSGRTWSLAATVKPEQGSFVFRAPHDGEYCFSIRTRDKQGKFQPDAPPQPEMLVVVDTIVPRLDLRATRGSAGELLADWQAVDPNLQPESVRIEYQTSPNDGWEPVAIDAPRDAQRHSVVGQSTWWPKAGGGPLTVRAQVLDRAGNAAVNQVVITPDGARTAGNTVSEPRSVGVPPGPSGRYPAAPSGGVTWPAETRTATRPAAPQPPPQTGSPDDRWRSSAHPAQTVGTAGGSVIRPAATRSDDSSAAGGNSAGVPVTSGNAEPLDFSVLPPGQRARMVKSRSFEIEYDIESIGPSGISKVELWGTRDGGRTWGSFGIDADNRSPLLVRVDHDGIYGFRIVVQSGGGAGGMSPQPGELPDLWIGLDRTRPAAKITSVDVGKDGTELAIRWEASDQLMESRPISLLMSDRPAGPWTPFASGLENTGSYVWPLDDRVPDQLYLRIEARDEAGNLGMYELAEPVTLHRQRPQGRIRGVRPVEQTQRTLPTRRR